MCACTCVCVCVCVQLCPWTPAVCVERKAQHWVVMATGKYSEKREGGGGEEDERVLIMTGIERYKRKSSLRVEEGHLLNNSLIEHALPSKTMNKGDLNLQPIDLRHTLYQCAIPVP